MCEIHIARCGRCKSLAAVWQVPCPATDDRFQTCGQVIRVDEPQRYCQACSESAPARSTRGRRPRTPVFLRRLQKDGADLVARSLRRLKVWCEVQQVGQDEGCAVVSERPKIHFVASAGRSRPASKVFTEHRSTALGETHHQDRIWNTQPQPSTSPPIVTGPGVQLPQPNQDGHQMPSTQTLSASSSVYSQRPSISPAHSCVELPILSQHYLDRVVPNQDITRPAEGSSSRRNSSINRAAGWDDRRMTWI